MKKVFVIVLALLVLTACVPVAQSMAVQLPEALIVAIGLLVMSLLTAAAKWLFDKFGIDLQNQFAEIAAAVSSVVVLLINYGLQLVPAAYDNLLSAVMAFLVVFLGGVGVFSFVTRNKRRAKG